MKNLKKKLWMILALTTSAPALAYIPPYSMIVSRTADNHGRGVFVIDQDVTFGTGSEAQTVRETWTIIDENHMKVSFQGVGTLKDSVTGVFLYEGAHRLENDNGTTRKHHVGDDWSEPLFHFRSSKAMKTHLVQVKIAPNESLREEPPMKSDGPPDYQQQPFLRLGRLNGMVTWEIAKEFASADTPALWIEQDQFVVSKIRNADKSSVEAADYAKYDGGLYFPKSRTYKWNDSSVAVNMRSIRYLGNTRPKDFSSTATLTQTLFPLASASNSNQIKEFYQRFR